MAAGRFYTRRIPPQVRDPLAPARAARRVRPQPRRLATPGPRRELLVALGLLLALGVAAYARHIRDGGWYMDDWANAAHTHYPGGSGSALDYYAGFTNDRPVLILYVPLTHVLFGEHMRLHLAWGVLLAVAMSGALYAVLRQLSLAPLHSLAIAALVLVFPFSDSARLWATASVASLGIAVYLAGVALALRGLRDGRGLRWHAIALAFYLVSILMYEITLAAVALTGALYLTVAPWRRVRVRWAADLGLALALALYVSSRTKHVSLPLSDQIDHARLIARGGLRIAADAAQPFAAAPSRLALVVVVLVVAAAALVRLRSAAGAERRSLRTWLAFVAGGAVAAAAAWAVYLPADPYYTPYPTGMANRVNVLAAIGVVVLLYATAALAGVLVARARPALAWVVPAAAALVLGVGYVRLLDRDEAVWDRAFAAEMSLLGQLKSVAGHPPPDTTILTFGHPAYEALGVPIFAANWDLNGAVKMQYNRADLAAYPMLPGVGLACGPQALRITSGGYTNAVPAPYGRLLLVDVPSGGVAQPPTQAACRSALTRFHPGPYVSPTR